MTVRGLAEYLAVSHSTIYKLLRKGHLPFLKVGGQYRFDKDEIDRWIANRQVKD
jgi:excisionase family DNA binding protein